MPREMTRCEGGAPTDATRKLWVAVFDQARRVLLKLPGCQHGPAVASAILTAGASDRMAVYDRRAVAALGALGYVDVDAR